MGMFHLQDEKDLHSPSIDVTELQDSKTGCWFGPLLLHRGQAAHSPDKVKFDTGLAYLNMCQRRLLLHKQHKRCHKQCQGEPCRPLQPLRLLLHLRLQAAHSWGRPPLPTEAGSPQWLSAAPAAPAPAAPGGPPRRPRASDARAERGTGRLAAPPPAAAAAGRGDVQRRHHTALCRAMAWRHHRLSLHAHEAACNRLCREDGGDRRC